MFKAIISFLSAAAAFLTEREKNVRLRLISETLTSLHDAKVHHYQLESAALTGPGESDRRDLAVMRIQDLNKFLREIRPAAST